MRTDAPLEGAPEGPLRDGRRHDSATTLSENAARPWTRKAPSRLSQLGTLLLRKEALLLKRRPCATICTLLLPAILSATGTLTHRYFQSVALVRWRLGSGWRALCILGASLSEIKKYDEKSYAPSSAAEALASLGPQILLPLMIETRVRAGPFRPPGNETAPAAVPPLDLYLIYAHAVSEAFHRHRLPP
eukprot:6184498-Pleurochrysis_carterae.AAC.2